MHTSNTSNITPNEQEMRKVMEGGRVLLSVPHKGQLALIVEGGLPLFGAGMPVNVSYTFVKMSPPKDRASSEEVTLSYENIGGVLFGDFNRIKSHIEKFCKDKCFVIGQDFYFLAEALPEPLG